MTDIFQQSSLFDELRTEEFFLENLRCHLIKTADDSYSLQYEINSETLTEAMHSSKGALAETLAIYKPALELSLTHRTQLNTWTVTSIGLGLGYNEILAAALACSHRLRPTEILIDSFESRPELIRSFQSYFMTPSASQDASHPLKKVYFDIVQRISDVLEISPQKLNGFICQLIQMSHLRFHSAISHEFFYCRVHRETEITTSECILFDAFSPASSPDLWTTELLQSIITTLASPTCVFASYASRTVLKHILKSAQFQLLQRQGFAGKRESTFAVRLAGGKIFK